MKIKISIFNDEGEVLHEVTHFCTNYGNGEFLVDFGKTIEDETGLKFNGYKFTPHVVFASPSSIPESIL